MEVQDQSNEKNRKKTVTAIIAVLCALALIMMGTYAYYNMVNAVNEFANENDNSAVLHDDYNEYYDETETEYEKNIYVENAGDIDLYIRVSLEEYLELENGSYKIPGYATYDENNEIYMDWHRHAYTVTADGKYVCEECELGFHAYFEWEMGNSNAQIFKLADADEKAAGTAFRYVEDSSVAGQAEDIWATLAGSVTNIPTPGSGYDKTVWGEFEQCEVLAMAEYWSEVEKFKVDPTTGIDPDTWEGWVLDTDGWAYWSQKLMGGETTGLLLGKVTKLENPPGEEYFYGIHAVLDAADGLDVGAWIDDEQETLSGEDPDLATADAIKLLQAIGAE